MGDERELRIDFTNGHTLYLTYDITTAIKEAMILTPGAEDRSSEEVAEIAVTFLSESILWWDFEDEEGPVPLEPSHLHRRLPPGFIPTVVHEICEDLKQEMEGWLKPSVPAVKPDGNGNGNGKH